MRCLCSPNKLSRVFGRAETGYYVVCLSCGREYAYDWSKMKITGKIDDVTVTPSISLDVPATE